LWAIIIGCVLAVLLFWLLVWLLCWTCFIECLAIDAQKGQRERANQLIREITSAEVSRVIAREVRRDNEEISRNIARTLTSDGGGNLWHKHPNTSIAPVERQRMKHVNTEMGIELKGAPTTGIPLR